MNLKEEKIRYVKMHGAGNDYVYINAIDCCPSDLPSLAKAISDRHFGVGGDGLVAIFPSNKADFRMRMFNSDGSEAQMCGNASRCIGKYVYDRGLTRSKRVTLETRAGIKILDLHIGSDGMVESVTVDMGEPELRAERVPAISLETLECGAGRVVMGHGNKKYEAVAVSMGNPHAVIFIDEPPADYHVLELGPRFECDTSWPEKTNVEFAHVLSTGSIEMRVWERGTGETLACGTGACATAVAGVLTGRTSRECEIVLKGGILKIVWDSSTGHVLMTGPAETVAEGIYYYKKGSCSNMPDSAALSLASDINASDAASVFGEQQS